MSRFSSKKDFLITDLQSSGGKLFKDLKGRPYYFTQILLSADSHAEEGTGPGYEGVPFPILLNQSAC